MNRDGGSARAPSNASTSAAAARLSVLMKMPVWATHRAGAPDGDVILSARARLARNIAGFPFPSRATERDLRRVAQEVRRAALADNARLAELYAVGIASLPQRERDDLIDARRISPELAEGGAERYALLDDEGALSIFVNEEDHVRIQALAAGSAAHAALLSAEDAEVRLAKRLTFARSERWGCLTTSLSNLGTGLRLSVLAHLPALAFVGRLEDTLKAAEHLGISIRGAHGEGSAAVGDLYQISNAFTYGPTTRQIAGRIQPVADYLVAAEREARAQVAADPAEARRAVQGAREAWARIEQAERLDAATTLVLLSRLRLAAACGLRLFGGDAAEPAPGGALFAELVAELRTGAGLATRHDVLATSVVRDAIQRPAKIRTALRPFYYLARN